LFFISLYGIDTNVIHLLVLFEHQCRAHCWDTNVICLFILFKHECYMSIYVVYTWKSCTQLSCLNNAWHLCLNNTNLWINKFRTNLEWTYEAYNFVMVKMFIVIKSKIDFIKLRILILIQLMEGLNMDFLQSS